MSREVGLADLQRFLPTDPFCGSVTAVKAWLTTRLLNCTILPLKLTCLALTLPHDRGGTAESSQTASEATPAVVVKGWKAGSQWHCRGTVTVLPPRLLKWQSARVMEKIHSSLQLLQKICFRLTLCFHFFQLKPGNNLLGYRHKPPLSA